MTDTSVSQGRWRSLFPYFALVLPAVVFYALIFKTVCDIPVFDDYALLDFLNAWTQLHGLSKLLCLLTFQHNEYKLIFENAVVAVQFSLIGHVNFYVLNLLGDVFVLGVFWMLIAMFQAPRWQGANRMFLLLPVSLLLFQLQYAIALNWAMVMLQYMAVIFFSLFAIHQLCRGSRFAFVLANLALVLAIASSTNGMLLIPVGLLLLLQQKRWKLAVLWLATGLLMVSLYHIQSSVSQPEVPLHDAVGEAEKTGHSLRQTNPVYALSFMGASFAGYSSYVPSVITGVLLCGVLALAVCRRYYLQNPAVFYTFVLLVLTAAGVAYIRSDFGVLHSLASRYRIFSNLLLILSYMFFAETSLPKLSATTRRGTVMAICVLCVAFCCGSDVAGYRLLAGRRAALIYFMAVWEHPEMQSPASNISDSGDPILKRQFAKGFYKPIVPTLQKSIRLGIYQPPPLLAP